MLLGSTNVIKSNRDLVSRSVLIVCSQSWVCCQRYVRVGTVRLRNQSFWPSRYQIYVRKKSCISFLQFGTGALINVGKTFINTLIMIPEAKEEVSKSIKKFKWIVSNFVYRWVEHTFWSNNSILHHTNHYKIFYTYTAPFKYVPNCLDLLTTSLPTKIGFVHIFIHPIYLKNPTKF